MKFITDELGRDINEIDYSPENAWERLWKLLNDNILRFNPYRAADGPLVECAMRGFWCEFPAITQMMVFTFLDIRRIKARGYSYEAVFFKVGNFPKEYFIPLSTFLRGTTYRATRKSVRHMNGSKRITNRSHVEDLLGKRYFVSHALLGRNVISGNIAPAYRMYRLRGTTRNQAKIIREAMVKAKIAMLEEVCKHPYNLDYLACPRHLIDYEPYVRQAMERIRKYPEAQIPVTKC